MKKVIVLLVFAFMALSTIAQTSKSIFVIEIKSDIDPRVSRYVKLAIEEFEESNADILLIEMDTYGGLVTDAKDIVESLLNFKKPVWVFIDKDAASAGALISIACDSIYMAPGASIGAATVVMGGGGEAAPDKYQSYMRSTMRSTAEEKGRDPRIAEAMVDQKIEIEGISKAGEVITFSTSEAIKNGFCEAKVSSIEEILERNEIEEYTITRFQLPTADKIVAFFINPFISGILILVIIGGIYFELQSPGVGFPILAASIALVLYLVPYYMNGLAENWEIIAFFVGIILIALEIFVIPGFGLAGVAGLSLTIGSLVLVMLNNDVFDFTFVPWDNIFISVSTTLLGLFGSIILMFYGGVRLTNTKFFNRVALMQTQNKSEGYTSSYNKTGLKGMDGEAFTNLRPSGRVIIDGEMYDAYTRGEYIAKGAKIQVVSEEGTSLKVKSIQE